MSTVKFKIESGMQLLARLIKKPEIDNFYPILFQSGPQKGDMIEISSDNTNPCLLVDLICETLCKSKFDGCNVGVVLFNTDGNINYDHLVHVLRKKICLNMKSELSPHNVDVDNFLQDILNNLNMLHIYDATQLYTTIHNLENILIELSNVSLIIFDTLTAFYWSEQGFKITKMDSYVENLLKIIQNVTKDYRITCLYTRPDYFSSKKDSNNMDLVVQSSEILNYRIQLLKSNASTGLYQVNVRNHGINFTKYFHTTTNGEVNWL